MPKFCLLSVLLSSLSDYIALNIGAYMCVYVGRKEKGQKVLVQYHCSWYVVDSKEFWTPSVCKRTGSRVTCDAPTRSKSNPPSVSQDATDAETWSSRPAVWYIHPSTRRACGWARRRKRSQCGVACGCAPHERRVKDVEWHPLLALQFLLSVLWKVSLSFLHALMLILFGKAKNWWSVHFNVKKLLLLYVCLWKTVVREPFSLRMGLFQVENIKNHQLIHLVHCCQSCFSLHVLNWCKSYFQFHHNLD